MPTTLASVLSLLLLFTSAAFADVAKNLEKELRKSGLASSSYGIAVEDLHSGKLIFSSGADRAMNPASSIKVLTTAAALSQLGPNFRFKTVVLQKGNDVCLKGFGDPSLVNETLWVLVEEARRAGLPDKFHDLIADESYFSAQRDHLEEFEGDKDRAFTAPVSALSLNFNSLTINADPTELGRAPIIQLDPDLPGLFIIKNSARTVNSAVRGDLRASISRSGKKFLVEISGAVSKTTPRTTIYRAVPDPAIYAGSMFAELYRRTGGTWSGEVRTGTCPANAKEILSFESPPLSHAVFGMNKFSNNFIAEMLIHALAKGGSTESGIAELRAWLKKSGIEAPGLVLENGSGLSRKTRISAGTLVAIVRKAATDLAIGPEFLSSLGIAGIDGTMRRRAVSGSRPGEIRAKSGSLSGVVSLTGVGMRPDGSEFAFAFLFNGAGAENYKIQDLEEELLSGLISGR